MKTLMPIVGLLFATCNSYADQIVEFNFTLKNSSQEQASSFTEKLNSVMQHSLDLKTSSGSRCTAAFTEFLTQEADIYVFSKLICNSPIDGSATLLSMEEMKNLIEKDLSKRTGIEMSVPSILPSRS